MLLLILIKGAVGWVLLSIIGTNLIGLVVRGLVYTVDDSAEAHPALQNEVNRLNNSNTVITFIFAIVLLLYLLLLLRFFNLGVMVSAIMLMLSRIPDLLEEIKTGHKINAKDSPKNLIYMLTLFLQWGALVVMWLSLA